MTKKKVDDIIVASLLTLAIFIFIYLFINYYIYGNANNNLSSMPTASITELHLWGYINGQPEYNINMNYAYIATTPQEQELGFMNQTSYGYGNMLFLFNNDNTSHCFWNKNTGTNLTLYWINWNAESSGSFNTKLGTITAITNLTAYNTTPECAVSEAVMESTSPQVLNAGDFISVIYNGK